MIKYLICLSVFIIPVFSNFSFGGYESTDLLEQAYQSASENDLIVNIGKTKNQVGNELLRGGMSIGVGDSVFSRTCFNDYGERLFMYDDNGNKIYIDDEQQCIIAGGTWKVEVVDVSYNPPLIVRIAKILLRITMVLAITMVIFNSVKYMSQVLSGGGKDLKLSDLLNSFKNVALGIIIALMSVSIVTLLISVPKSSLTTSDDVTALEFGCTFIQNSERYTLPLHELKEYLCKNYQMGYEDSNLSDRERKFVHLHTYGETHMDTPRLSADRCKVQYGGTWKWVRIKDKEAKEMCQNELHGNYGF